MKKLVFVYLLMSFMFSPFLNIMGSTCHDEQESQICKMLDEIDEHEQNSNHCHGCHLNINFPKIQTFSFSRADTKENLLDLVLLLSYLDNFNNLYKPPIV